VSGNTFKAHNDKIRYFAVKNYRFTKSVSFPKIKGDYRIEIYFKTRTGKVLYCHNDGKKINFFQSPKYQSDLNALKFITVINRNTLLQSISDNGYAITGSDLSLSNAQRNEISLFTKKLCKGKKTAYLKTKAIYKWLIDNIYYNNEATGIYDNGNNNAYYVFKNKRAVCEGYTRLLQEMLASQGIPSVYLYGDGNGGMKLDSVQELHSWVAIYADNRWFFADPTWDSNNEYNKKKYHKESSDLIYFDMNLQSFSMTHATQGIEYGEVKNGFPITFMNGRITALAYEGNSKVITYPSTYHGMKIRGVNAQYIEQNFATDVTQITIPSGYKYMDIYSLQYYPNLKKLYLPESIKSISKGMLENSFKKTKVYAKGSSYAYRRCCQLKYKTVKK
jgi:hypothetical protein